MAQTDGIGGFRPTRGQNPYNKPRAAAEGRETSSEVKDGFSTSETQGDLLIPRNLLQQTSEVAAVEAALPSFPIQAPFTNGLGQSYIESLSGKVMAGFKFPGA